jgi:radical SAM protein with 4Fe4S-binding SPASM domain
MATNTPFDFFIQWHLTERCNLSCKHCYQVERRSDELSMSEIRDVIDEISDMLKAWETACGVAVTRSINVTGGEPFLRREIFEILEEIKEKGFSVYLLTNGTLVSRDRAKKLAGLGIDGVQVSIEGPEDVHNDIRGSGSFGASEAGIERLIDFGVPVTLNVTLSTLNADQAKKIIAFGSHVGARRIGFSRLVPYGRGSSLVSCMLTTEQVKALYASLLSTEVEGLEIVIGDPLASQMKLPSHGDSGSTAFSGCAAGVSGLTILPDGDISPCRRMPIVIGNVKRDSLREIWSTSPVLESLRDRKQYTGACRTCSRWAHCRGCRAIAYAHSRSGEENDFLAGDPQCFLRTTTPWTSAQNGLKWIFSPKKNRREQSIAP